MNEEIAALLADLQAQVVALRVAVEGTWLSLLTPDPDPAAAARRLGEQNVAAIRSYTTNGGIAEALTGPVIHHTEQLWGSIAWQLDEAKKA